MTKELEAQELTERTDYSSLLHSPLFRWSERRLCRIELGETLPVVRIGSIPFHPKPCPSAPNYRPVKRVLLCKRLPWADICASVGGLPEPRQLVVGSRT